VARASGVGSDRLARANLAGRIGGVRGLQSELCGVAVMRVLLLGSRQATETRWRAGRRRDHQIPDGPGLRTPEMQAKAGLSFSLTSIAVS